MLPLDLSSTTVFLDFDGTITQHDSCVHLLNRTTGDAWRTLEDQYVSGAIGSRECLQRQWQLIPNRDEQELRQIVREVPLDPGFPALIAALRGAGAEVVVLSDGYGFYAEEICEDQGLTLISNQIDWHEWSVGGVPTHLRELRLPGLWDLQAGRDTGRAGAGPYDRPRRRWRQRPARSSRGGPSLRQGGPSGVVSRRLRRPSPLHLTRRRHGRDRQRNRERSRS